MSINKEADFGTNKNHSLNEDYYIYYLKEGTLSQNYIMIEMIINCLEYIDEFNKGADKVYTIEQTRVVMQAFFPKLKL